MISLFIAGSSPAVPRPHRASSGYLIRAPNIAIGLELGSGALAGILPVQDIKTLDALLISHMHADHFFDIVPLRYALKYETRRRSPLAVYLPPGGLRTLETVVSPLASDGSFFDGVMQLQEYVPAHMLKLRDAHITFARTLHYIEGYAMRVQIGPAVIAFSSDTAPTPEVIDLARDADIFLCECALGAHGREIGRRGHSSAREAGEMAHAAGVKHLVLTHYSASQRPSDLKRAALSSFAGSVTIADDGLEIPLCSPR